MTEPQKTEEEIKAETEAAEKAKVEPPQERKVPESALTKQALDYKAKIEKLEKKLNSIDTEKSKAEEADLLKKNEHLKVIAAKEATIKQMEADIAAKDRKMVEASAREQLRNLGMNDALYLQGALAGLPADATAETIGTWSEALKASNPTAFTAPATPIKAADPGDPSVSHNNASIAQLKADLNDPAKAKAASAELERRVMSGESI